MAVEGNFFGEQWAAVGCASERVEDRVRVEVIHDLVRTGQQTRGAQDGTFEAVRKVIGEPHLGRTAQRAVGHGEVASAEGVVDHLAHFHNRTRVGTSFAVDDNAKYDRIVSRPSRFGSSQHRRVVDRWNAVAGIIGPVEGPIVDQDTAPGHDAPVEHGVVGHQRFPCGFDGGVDVALAGEVVGRLWDVPANERAG